MSGMTIGQLAAAAGVNPQTIRYYERRGVIETASRSTAGYRQYSQDDLRRLRFIKHAQTLGFTLDQVQELLLLRATSANACSVVEAKTREKLGEVEMKIHQLENLKQVLNEMADACRAGNVTSECPILESLDRE